MGGVALVLDLPQAADGHVFAELLHRQPAPGAYTTNFNYYLVKSPTMRLSTPTSALRPLSGSECSKHSRLFKCFSLVLQLNSVAAVAMKRYARLASRFPDGRRQGTQDPRVHLTSADPTHFEHDILTFIVMLSTSFRLRQRPDLSCPHSSSQSRPGAAFTHTDG